MDSRKKKNVFCWPLRPGAPDGGLNTYFYSLIHFLVEIEFEIDLEGIGFNIRHKSGVALRFPRILRWRHDKKADEIDDIEEVKKLIR